MTDIPGVKNNTFKINFGTGGFEQCDLESLEKLFYKQTFKEKLYKFIQRTKRFFGFYFTNQVKVLSDPIRVADDWTYNVKMISKSIYWFGIKVRVIKYE